LNWIETKFSFFPKIVVLWNAITPDIVSANPLLLHVKQSLFCIYVNYVTNLYQIVDVLTQYKQSESNPLVIQQHFAKIRSASSECSVICTGGSKDGDVE
jgi:hypothetical protein